MANNGQTSGELAQNILEAMDILAKAEVNSAQFDKTVIAIIVSCEDAAAGRYRCQYQDSIFNAFSSALDVTYTKGTSVQVRIPNNDWEGRKIIIGTCQENGIDYGTVVEDPLLRYEMVGSDCASNKIEEGLCTYWIWNEETEVNNKVIYDRDKDINLIGLDTQMVWRNIKESDSLILGATIKTAIDKEQRFSGDYGIKYTLTFENLSKIDTEDNTTDRYYIVDIDKMSGDPYSYDKGTDQLLPFDVDSEHFLYVKKIELYAKNFPVQDDDFTREPDIIFSNVRFQCANRLSDEEFNGTGLWIVTPEGNYFREDENLSTKRAIAELRIRGKITGSTRKVEYFWFIEDLSIDRTSALGYHKYAGRGWRCLNEYNVTEGDDNNPTTIQYVSAIDTLQVKKDTTRSRETRYKCVAIYNGTILEKEFVFTNYDIKDEITITCDVKPDFIDSIGKVTLTCLPADAAFYKWAKVDYEGGFEPIWETTYENKEYHDDIKLRDDLLAALANKTRADNADSRAELQKYQDWIDAFDYKTRIEGNKIYNIQAASIFQSVVYKCQVFDKDGKSLGIGQQLITNTLKADGDEQLGNLIIKNGNQVYKYDAKGIAPTSEQWQDPQVVLPLSFILREADGTEVNLDAIRSDDCIWVVPTEGTMIDKVEGLIVDTDTVNKLNFYKGKSLSYTIAKEYCSTYDNNEIQLQVKYNGMLYIATTTLYFIKDGESGTNGTEYVLKIIPNNTVGRLKTVKAGQTGVGSDWYVAELWMNGERIFRGSKNPTDNSGIKLTWSMLHQELDSTGRTSHNVKVSSNGTTEPIWTAVPSTQYSETATDIIQATLTMPNAKFPNKVMSITASQPIIYARTYVNETYDVSLKNGTGFTHVTYSEDGFTPDYDNKVPFEMAVKKKISGQWGDITGHQTLSYNWKLVGNLAFKSGYNNTMAKVMVEPEGYFNSEEMGNAVICDLFEGNTTIGTFRIPIHFLLNTYGHSALNEWKGNTIELDADGGTMLLAPQAGFGRKESDNSYTGVLMGDVKDYKNDVAHNGIFGYNHGVRTMFLNAENGSAIFGSTGSSQIVVDPASENARLYSHDFYKNYNPKTGLPTSYDANNENIGHDPLNPAVGKGMLIDLTKPEIRWGNKNFSVNEKGFITAQGGGKIAGWKINDYRIDSVDNGEGSDKTGKTGMSSVYAENAAGVTQWNVYYPGGNINKAIAFWAGGTGTSGKFHVAHDGYTRMTEATIGSGTNTGNLIYIGNNSNDKGNSALFTFNHQTLDTSANNGFYLGTDGLSLGSQFKALNTGVIKVGKGAVNGSSTKHWTIDGQNGDESRIYYQKQTLDSATDGVYIGTDGIALGDNTSADGKKGFQIKRDGSFVFRGGYIGNGSKGWTITDTQIYNGKPAYDNANAGVYIGTDGIGIGINDEKNGSAFWVKRDGSFMAKTGTIGGWSVTHNKIYSSNITMNANGSIICSVDGTTKWEIKQNGNATFNDLTANGTGHIGGWTISSNKLYTNNVTLNASGDIVCTGGKGWYIYNNGKASFGGNLTINEDGSITMAGGKLQVSSGGNLTINAGGIIFDASKTTQEINDLKGKTIELTGQLAAASAALEGALTAGGNISGKAITGTSLSAGSGTISTTGTISGGTIKGKFQSSDGSSGLTEDFDIVTWVGNLEVYVYGSVYQASVEEGGSMWRSGFENRVGVRFQVNKNHLTFKDGILTGKKDIDSDIPYASAKSAGRDAGNGTTPSWTTAPAWHKDNQCGI